jgi:acyl-coenzyme A synthetase/AMP-(fatty) acid ligase
MRYFFIDGDLKVSYKQLVVDINEKNNADGVYGKLLNILTTLCGDLVFNTIDDLLKYLTSNSNDLSIKVHTSGTTGEPKEIIQKFSNVIRYVKETSSDYVWGFAYNPLHFAGLQVLFQAILNKNTLVFVFNKDFKDIPTLLETHGVTHISCTPTFMKMLIPHMYQIDTLQSVSFGGERLSEKILDKTKSILPKVKIRNIYASSEAGSVLSSNDIGFYIPQRYVEYVKVIDLQLCIHKTLLGNFKLEGDWYHTGDYVKYIDDTHFKFDSRSSEVVNTGGYKVSLPKIERVIDNIVGVSNVVVYGRKNSIIGTIIVAEIVSDGDTNTIRELIKTTPELSDYERPKVIKFVDSLSLTNTGKVKRI